MPLDQSSVFAKFFPDVKIVHLMGYGTDLTKLVVEGKEEDTYIIVAKTLFPLKYTLKKDSFYHSLSGPFRDGNTRAFVASLALSPKPSTMRNFIKIAFSLFKRAPDRGFAKIRITITNHPKDGAVPPLELDYVVQGGPAPVLP